MVNIWLIYGSYMVNIWLIYGSYMVNIWLMMINNNLVGGFSPYPPEKWWSVPSQFSWDDEIPTWMESHKIPWFQTTNQYIYI